MASVYLQLCRHTPSILILALCAMSANAAAQTLPDSIDLRAAYCIPITQNAISVLGSFSQDGRALPADADDLLMRELTKARDNLAHMQRYLLPRLSALEVGPLMAARQQALSDIRTNQALANSCLSKCKDAECLSQCAGEPAQRMRKCQSSDWLPF